MQDEDKTSLCKEEGGRSCEQFTVRPDGDLQEVCG